MNFTTQATPEPYEIINSLKEAGVQVIPSIPGAIKLEHALTDDEFHALIISLMQHHKLVAQDENWLPGNPTNDEEDFGYYVMPENQEEYGEMFMFIKSDYLTYC